jgi:hypothetical protein
MGRSPVLYSVCLPGTERAGLFSVAAPRLICGGDFIAALKGRSFTVRPGIFWAWHAWYKVKVKGSGQSLP